MEEKNCQLCATYEIYEGFLEAGYDSEEAFHLAVGLLLENIVEDVVETTYDKAYDIGLKEGKELGFEKGFEQGSDIGYRKATVDIADIMVAYARSANED